MRPREPAVLFFAVWLALTWVSCSGEQSGSHSQGAVASIPGDKRLEPDQACSRDVECRLGFCDRGICVALYGKGGYGGACEPLPPREPRKPQPPPPSGEIRMRTGPEDTCGGYICIDRRCRSCQSDSECQSQLSDMVCGIFYDSPGKICGRVADLNRSLVPLVPATPPSSTTPPPPPPCLPAPPSEK